MANTYSLVNKLDVEVLQISNSICLPVVVKAEILWSISAGLVIVDNVKLSGLVIRKCKMDQF